VSKERELLQRVRDVLRGLKETHYDLYWDIQTALDQPEQVQEPVAWKGRAYGNLHHVDYGNSIPLYTAPSKQKPLSDDAICEILLKKEWKGFVELVRMIEKAHGITGGGE
jgi:hypothetical protein